MGKSLCFRIFSRKQWHRAVKRKSNSGTAQALKKVKKPLLRFSLFIIYLLFLDHSTVYLHTLLEKTGEISYAAECYLNRKRKSTVSHWSRKIMFVIKRDILRYQYLWQLSVRCYREYWPFGYWSSESWQFGFQSWLVLLNKITKSLVMMGSMLIKITKSFSSCDEEKKTKD
jgi:hypothetical protein